MHQYLDYLFPVVALAIALLALLDSYICWVVERKRLEQANYNFSLSREEKEELIQGVRRS